ncbi:MAG TPA: class I SAM-dependent methyltransferase [Candidatus Saccharimonadales bacterium]|nr:class I SAM-dependent methyltransferase [Candidatus Saccharimonadales bacterium]
MSRLTDDEELTKAAYDEHAEVWAAKYQDDKFYADEYQKFHGYLPSGKVIDIGAGSGRDAEALTKLGYGYVGVDISTSLLEIAQKRVPGAKFINQSVYDLSFSEKFDGFWCTATLLHIPQSRIKEALEAIKSVLKPGAVGFITIKDGHDYEVEEFEIEPGTTLKRFYQYWSREDFERVLLQNGFEELEYKYRPVNPRQKWHYFFVKLK